MSQIDQILANDSCESKLKIFQNLVQSWNSKINLVSPKSLPDLWERHICDSLQLCTYLPQDSKTINILDLGSGAGLPGLVMAIADPRIRLTSIDSDSRKIIFQREAARLCGISGNFISERIENIQTKDFPADWLVSRALAPLSLLCRLSWPWLSTGSHGLFLKGKDILTEIQDLKAQNPDFTRLHIEIFPARQGSNGHVVHLWLKDVYADETTTNHSHH